MPHDIDNTELKKGYRVVVEFEVDEVTPVEQFCNVRLVKPLLVGGDVTVVPFWLNSRQVRKVP